jgi:shikimate kinase
MRISLIGMTGTGKSYWSKRLAKEGFKRISCDDLIAEKLAPEINQYNDSIKSLGEWMGRPYEARYKERAARYLELEKAMLLEIIASLDNAQDPSNENVVIDTTGSVIYTGQGILLDLKKHSTLVHLTTPPEIQKQVMAYYLAKPGPVLWLDKFNIQPGESYQDAVTRCYPILLASREATYALYADIPIDYYTRRKEGFGVVDFLRLIKEHAQKKSIHY